MSTDNDVLEAQAVIRKANDYVSRLSQTRARINEEIALIKSMIRRIQKQVEAASKIQGNDPEWESLVKEFGNLLVRLGDKTLPAAGKLRSVKGKGKGKAKGKKGTRKSAPRTTTPIVNVQAPPPVPQPTPVEVSAQPIAEPIATANPAVPSQAQQDKTDVVEQQPKPAKKTSVTQEADAILRASFDPTTTTPKSLSDAVEKALTLLPRDVMNVTRGPSRIDQIRIVDAINGPDSRQLHAAIANAVDRLEAIRNGTLHFENATPRLQKLYQFLHYWEQDKADRIWTTISDWHIEPMCVAS